MFDLDRFRQAQKGRPGIAEALRELRAGAKTGHWIWYIFPQLRGLGTSPMAVRYGLESVEEGAAYLGDPGLGVGLALATEAVKDQIAAGVPLDVLMGSQIDVRKLVSSMTLFGHVAPVEHARLPFPGTRVVAHCAGVILRTAAALGYPACAFTEERIRAIGLD